MCVTRPSELAPGDYRLAVDIAAFRVVEVKTRKTFEVAAKVATAEKEFEGTAITPQKVDGVAEIHRAWCEALAQGPVNALVEGDLRLTPSDPDLADLASAIDSVRMNLRGVELLIHVFDFRLNFDRLAGFEFG